MRSQIPKLLQTNPGNIYNVVGLSNWCWGVVPILQSCTHWHHKLYQVFIKGKQSKELSRRLAIILRFRHCMSWGFLIRCHGLRVQMSHFVNIYRYSASVATPCPLWVLRMERISITTGKSGIRGNISQAYESGRTVPNRSCGKEGLIDLHVASLLCLWIAWTRLEPRSDELEGSA